METNSILQLNTFLCYYASHISTNIHFVLKMFLHKRLFFFTCGIDTDKNQSKKISPQNGPYSQALRYICSYFAKLFYESYIFIPTPWTSQKYFAPCRENSDFMLGRILSNIYKHKIVISGIHTHIINTRTPFHSSHILIWISRWKLLHVNYPRGTFSCNKCNLCTSLLSIKDGHLVYSYRHPTQNKIKSVLCICQIFVVT